MMKKFTLSLLCMCIAASVSFPLSVKLSSEVWVRGTASYRASDMSNTYNGFSVERGYLTVEPIFNDNLVGKLTLDITSPSALGPFPAANVYSPIKVKYAYLSIENMIPTSSLMIGVINHFMGTVYDWKYNSIDKALIDKYGFVKSADIGIAFKGTALEKMIEYAVFFVNGEGFDLFGTALGGTSGIDLTPEVGANVRVSPIGDMLTVGASFSYTHTGSRLAYNISDGLSRYVYSANAKFAVGPLTVLGEFAGAQFPKTAPGYTSATTAKSVVTTSATSAASATYKQLALCGSALCELSKIVESLDVDAGLLCDFYDVDADATNDLRIDTGVNASINLARDEKKNKQVQLMFAYTASFRQTALGSYAINSHLLQAQVKMKFGTTIK